MGKKTKIIFAVIFLVAWGKVLWAGETHFTLNSHIEALQSEKEDSPASDQLRKKIIGLAQKIKPLLKTPEKADRHMLRGEAAVEMATSQAGFLKAAKEFKAALYYAPWLAAGYFNLSLVQEKAGLYKQAMKNAEFYLLAAPGASDTENVRRRIVKLEYKAEEATVPVPQEESKGLKDLVGIWREYYDGTYSRVMYFRIEKFGEELVIYSAWDKDGIETAVYRFWLQGHDLTGEVIGDYAKKDFSSPHVKGTLNEDFTEIEFSFWLTHGKMTPTYRKE